MLERADGGGHVVPGNDLLPAPGGMVITRCLREWVCLLPLDVGMETTQRLLGRLTQEPEGVTLRVLASPAFREVVVFTPPHRQAFCIEPYTCITDAINLQQRGVDAGLQVLAPGQEWTGTVRLEVTA